MDELIEKTIKSIKEDILKDYLSLQSVFDRHIGSIENLKKEGVSYQFLYNSLSLDISENHFRNLLYRAKKKNNSNDNKIKTDTPKTNKYFNILDWQLVLSDISQSLAYDIYSKNYTPNDVENWIKKHSIANQTQLRQFFNNLTRKAK